jgi:hypothetical protein
MSENNKGLDVLGIKPVAEAVNTVTEATTKGAAAFLGRICLPAAEEFGFLLQDKVRASRAANQVKIALKAEQLVQRNTNAEGLHAHPRIVGTILDQGGWADEDEVQSMWAGLLSSACTPTGRSQENLIFVTLLSQITFSEAKIINYSCEKATKRRTRVDRLCANGCFRQRINGRERNYRYSYPRPRGRPFARDWIADSECRIAH